VDLERELTELGDIFGSTVVVQVDVTIPLQTLRHEQEMDLVPMDRRHLTYIQGPGAICC
jgi:hypothetical protein